MTDTTADIGVEQARGWANRLIAASHRGPGDTVEAAIHRAAVKHGLDPKALWRLRYRTPKDMLVSTWKQVKSAYEAECGRQEARLRHELAITRALPATPARLALVAETEAFLATLESEAGRASQHAGAAPGWSGAIERRGSSRGRRSTD